MHCSVKNDQRSNLIWYKRKVWTRLYWAKLLRKELKEMGLQPRYIKKHPAISTKDETRGHYTKSGIYEKKTHFYNF